MPGELRFALDQGGERAAFPRHPALQTARAVTLSVRQIKGSHIEQFAQDVERGDGVFARRIARGSAYRVDPR